MLVDVRDGKAYVRFGGGCQGCASADVTLKEGVAKTLQQEIPEIVELDLNPVIVSQEGAVAVDVKLRVAPYAPRPELAHRRLR